MDLANMFKDLTGGDLKLDSNVLNGALETLGILNQKKEENDKAKEAKKDGEPEEEGQKEKKEITETAVQTDDGNFRAANAELDKAVELSKSMDAKLDLKDVVAPTTMGETAIKQMENVNMSKLIGAPINAAVEAQFDAARKMLACVKEIGVKDDKLATVTFNFTIHGRKAAMTVPLLTLVPISAMRIKELTYEFKLKIDTGSSINLQSSAESSISYGTGINSKSQGQSGQSGQGSQGGQGDEKKSDLSQKSIDTLKNAAKPESTFSTSFSSKKDSRATQNSKYDVETTMDISMTVGPEDQPAGISKMLEILNNTIEIHNPDGELTVDNHRVNLVNGVAVASVTYIDGNGLYAPGKVTCKLNNAKDDKIRVIAMDNGNQVDLLFIQEGWYTVTAGKLSTYIIVDDPTKAPASTEETKNGAPAPDEEEPKVEK